MESRPRPRPSPGRPSILRRLGWPRMSERGTPISEDRALMARTYTYLFGLGATLLLITLPLPHSTHRETLGVAIPAAIAYAAAGAFTLAVDRIPLWVFRTAPALGAVLATCVVYFGGVGAMGAYAMYFFWVVLAACYFLGPRIALAHIAFAAALYGAALADRGLTDGWLYWVMAAGTLSVFGLLTVGLRTQTERVVARLADAAGTDPLTELSNRRELEEHFGREIDRSQRTGRPLGLIVLDLDWFKEVNDRFGHDTGDRTLQRLADVLTRVTRSIDTVARLGGEEFAVLAPEANDDASYNLAERLRREVKTEFAGDALPLTASCGVASFPDSGVTPAGLLRAADRALYAAKDLGRDRSVVFRSGDMVGYAEGEESDRPTRAGPRLSMLIAIAEAVDRRKRSPGHAQAVGRYAEAIARQLGLPEPTVEQIALAGLLHDIGTVGVGDPILAKSGPLAEAEWQEMRRHPELGARILANADLDGVADLVLAHHERPDGEGYPNGLRDGQIPPGAQIIAVADAYAAMTSDRVYKPGLTPEAAREEIRSAAGTQFDPEVVDAFLSLEEGGEAPSEAA
jgi:diguanylate cyclase (GGDEF)-like protein